MKVVHVSYSVSSSSANTRLHYALLNSGVDSKILTLAGDSELKEVYSLKKMSVFEKKVSWLFRYIFEYICIEKGMPFYCGRANGNILNNNLIKEADIIHLHWVCDFVSPYQINELLKSGKKIIWTCHDSWPFTGGCNVRYGCNKFEKDCKRCPRIKVNWGENISSKILKNKMRFLEHSNIVFVAPSNWMRDNLKKSLLFKYNKCVVIPNTVDFSVYQCKKIQEIESNLDYKKDSNKIHILFGATNINIPYKGFEYLLQVLESVESRDSSLLSRIVLHILGDVGKIAHNQILNKYECKFWGFISSEEKRAAIYSLADYFIYPSLDDNLPNMVMESMACETPVICFETGGIPDMVKHKLNGYVAKYKDVEDLYEGIKWSVSNNERNCLGKYARETIVKMCNEEKIVNEHKMLYTN